jgi:hypothetical protein
MGNSPRFSLPILDLLPDYQNGPDQLRAYLTFYSGLHIYSRSEGWFNNLDLFIAGETSEHKLVLATIITQRPLSPLSGPSQILCWKTAYNDSKVPVLLFSVDNSAGKFSRTTDASVISTWEDAFDTSNGEDANMCNLLNALWNEVCYSIDK